MCCSEEKNKLSALMMDTVFTGGRKARGGSNRWWKKQWKKQWKQDVGSKTWRQDVGSKTWRQDVGSKTWGKHDVGSMTWKR
jgi:hypothetical protein